MSEPTSLSGDEIIFNNSFTHDAPYGECAFASYPERSAEICIGIRPQEASDEVKEIWEETGAGKSKAISALEELEQQSYLKTRDATSLMATKAMTRARRRQGECRRRGAPRQVRRPLGRRKWSHDEMRGVRVERRNDYSRQGVRCLLPVVLNALPIHTQPPLVLPEG